MKPNHVSTHLGMLALCAGLALAPASTMAAPQIGHEHLGRPAIAGTWRLMGNPEPTCGVLPFVNFTTITADGKLINADPVVGTGLGEVRRSWKQTYNARFQGFIVEGANTLTYQVRGELTLQSANHFNGHFTADVADMAGNVLCSYQGTIAADRI